MTDNQNKPEGTNPKAPSAEQPKLPEKKLSEAEAMILMCLMLRHLRGDLE
jgi:hypothetical protein